MEGVNPNKLVQKWRDFETGVKDRCPLARYNSNSSWRTNEGWRKRRLSSQHSQLTRYTSSHDAYPMIIQPTRIRFALIKVLFLRLLSFATFRFLLSYTLSWNFSLAFSGRLIILKLSEPISRPSFDKVISCQVNYFTRMIQVIESQALGSNRQTPARPPGPVRSALLCSRPPSSSTRFCARRSFPSSPLLLRSPRSRQHCTAASPCSVLCRPPSSSLLPLPPPP